MTCSTCRFHHEDTCRRYPPQPTVFVMEGRHPITGQPAMRQQVIAAFPPVQPHMMCGEHDEQPTGITLSLS